VGEVHTFESFSASVDPAGNATLVIDLATVATNVDLRDERVRTHVFETAIYPTATATFTVDMNLVQSIPVGSSLELPVSATLAFHGISQPLTFDVWIARLAETKLSVATTKAILLDALAFDLGTGIDTLVQLAGLSSLSAAVPVEFLFTLNRY
jgi:polyisoprenoid-binding protein YceI